MDQMSSMLGSLGLGPMDGSESLFNPLFKPLVKDIIYPMMSEIVKKFPEWLEQHKGDMSEEERANSTEQMKVIQSIVDDIEKETPDDSEQVIDERYRGIMKKIKDLEKLGHIPPDLIDACPQLPDMPSSLPGMDPSQCSIF